MTVKEEDRNEENDEIGDQGARRGRKKKVGRGQNKMEYKIKLSNYRENLIYNSKVRNLFGMASNAMRNIKRGVL